MYPFQFWKEWSKSYQVFFWILSLCFLTSLTLLWKGWYQYPAPAITYDHYQQLQSIEVPMHSFNVGLVNLQITAENNLILENIFGSALTPSTFSSYFFLTTLVAAFVIFMSILPALSRYRFLMSVGIAALFMASMQIDSLQIFGLHGRIVTIALIAVMAALAFYFHSFRTEAKFIERLLVFTFFTLAIALLIFFFSKVQLPFLRLSVTGLISGLVICLIVVVTVAHEFVALFVELITRSTKSEKNLQHFLILTSVYLINVFLMYCSKMKIIEWSFFSVSPFVLFGFSALLGVWGFRSRAPQQEDILNEEPLRIYFYLSLVLVAFGVLGYFMSSASDMMIDAFEDLILAAHIGCGLIFVLYVIANFGPMLAKNLSVYKILYKPDTMPHFTFRLMSVIATFAVLSWAVNWKTYINQMAATYYHAYGDLYLVNGDLTSAEVYYNRSIQFRNQNLHAHYALANIYAALDEPVKEKKEYEKALVWNSSVPAYLNLSNVYNMHNDLLETALTLDDANKKFPGNGTLQNATGLSFLKLKSADSAIYFFERAKNSSDTKIEGETNLLAAFALFNVKYKVDSVILATEMKKGITTNSIALANLQQKQLLTEGKFSSDTSLSVYEAAWMGNYLINQKNKIDTSLIYNAIKLAQRPINSSFEEFLLVASAHALYNYGQVNEAVKIIRDLTYRKATYNQFSLLGLWLLEQQNPLSAAIYLERAAERSATAFYYLALAQTEADSLKQALISWDSLSKSSDKNVAAFAGLMRKVLRANPEQAAVSTNEEKYYFCRYRIPLTDKTLFSKISSSISDAELQAQAIIDRSEKWFAMDEPDEANYLLAQLNTVYPRNINQQIARMRLMIAAEKKDWTYVQKNISETEINSIQRNYFDALAAAQSGDPTAAKKFDNLCKANFQYEEGVIAAVKFFANDTTDQLKNFSRLVEGLVAKPNSVKILKLHAVMAASLGFYDAAQDSLDKLKVILPKESLKKYIEANKDLFSL